jgi:hypothetical protein
VKNKGYGAQSKDGEIVGVLCPLDPRPSILRTRNLKPKR